MYRVSWDKLQTLRIWLSHCVSAKDTGELLAMKRPVIHPYKYVWTRVISREFMICANAASVAEPLHRGGPAAAPQA
jgi:hypothetical protein